MNITTWFNDVSILARMLYGRRKSIEYLLDVFSECYITEDMKTAINIELSEYNDYVTGVL